MRKQSLFMAYAFCVIAVAFVFILPLQTAEAKKAKCSEQIHKKDRDFFYCTKFSVGKGRAFKTWYTARFTGRQPAHKTGSKLED